MKNNMKFYQQLFNGTRNKMLVKNRIKAIIIRSIEISTSFISCIITTPFIPIIWCGKKVKEVINNLKPYSFKNAWKWCDKNLPNIIRLEYYEDEETYSIDVPNDFCINYSSMFNSIRWSNKISQKDKIFAEKFLDEIYYFIVNYYAVDGFTKHLSTDNDFFDIVCWEFVNKQFITNDNGLPLYVYFKENQKEV